MPEITRNQGPAVPAKGPLLETPAPAPPGADKLAASAVATLDMEVCVTLGELGPEEAAQKVEDLKHRQAWVSKEAHIAVLTNSAMQPPRSHPLFVHGATLSAYRVASMTRGYKRFKCSFSKYLRAKAPKFGTFLMGPAPTACEKVVHVMHRFTFANGTAALVKSTDDQRAVLSKVTPENPLVGYERISVLTKLEATA